MNDNFGWVKIAPHLLPKDISEEEVLKIAYENTIKEHTFIPMQEILKRMMNIEPDILEENIPLVVISNENMNYGASALINQDLLCEVAEKYFQNENMMIIPSSIHECICTPYNDTINLKQMVQEVNENEVTPIEVLSNEVFIFDVTSKKLMVAR